jgi:hypothetical protein
LRCVMRYRDHFLEVPAKLTAVAMGTIPGHRRIA